MDKKLTDILERFQAAQGKITILTGAGISAESGIPTFRGKEGYWTVGSKEYHPEEMATQKMFQRQPYDVWQWYLYRKGVCNKAQPNPGHRAIADLEAAFADRFCLITQNVDGLHLRAGNSRERTYQIHGNIDFMRCAGECCADLFPVPPGIGAEDKNTPITDAEKKLLVCPHCKSASRPHVLWFDECYDEQFFRFQSSIQKACETDLLIVIGTSGATNLPMQVGSIVADRGAAMIDVNPDENPFSYLAQKQGYFYRGKGSEILPDIVRFLGRKS